MGAASVAQEDDSPVAQIRKPDKAEAALDVALLDMRMKENPGFLNTIDSPDSVLSASLKENSGGVSNESAAVHNVNGVDTGLSTSGITQVDKIAEGKLTATCGVTGVEVLTPTVGVKEDTGEQDSDIKKGDTLETSIFVVQTSTAKAIIAHEMEEISLFENGEQKGSFKKTVSATESQPAMNDSKMVESNNKNSTVPGLEDRSVSQPNTSSYDAVEPGSSKQEGHAKLIMAEKEDALVTPGTISQPVIAENLGAELKIKTEVAKANERTEREEKLAVLAASATGSLPTSKYARASEIQEAAEPVTPPTPGRIGTVIRLTRQMSQVSTAISPGFEVRAAKEIQDLQEKVKLMEEESRRKSAVIETLSFNQKERETELLNKIECLELANEQLLQGGNDSSIQLQMELTRLQRQNSELQVCKRELQFQINHQEMIQTQMLDKRPAPAEATNPVEQLESKVSVLESKLAEAVEVSTMYKNQLHEALASAQSAALLNLCDPGEVLKELQKLRKQNKEQEAELVDFQDRYFMMSVRLAETAGQKEELQSKLKRIQGLR